MNDLLIANVVQTSQATRQPMDGREHLVVPVVAMKEGVMKGMLYPADEIRTNASAWNGVPVPVRHPVVDGKFVSANTPQYEETINIGRFFNANADQDGTLKGEIWVDVEKANRLGYSEVVERLDAGQTLEVSTGLFNSREHKSGFFDSKTYSGIVRNIKPDHLAFTMEEKGACSIEDGCGAGTGITANCGDKECEACSAKATANQSVIGKAVRAIEGALTTLIQKGDVQANVAHSDIRLQLNNVLESEAGDNEYSYVEDVFDDYFVYERDGKLYRRDYTEANGVVSVSSEKTEVIRETVYRTASPITGNNATNPNQEDSIMNRDELVANVIADASNSFSDADKETLMKLEDKALQALQSSDETPSETPKAQEKPADTANVVEANVLTPEELEAVKTVAANQARELADKKSAVVKHYPNVTEELVANMAADAVTVLYDNIKPTPNYAGRGGAGFNANQGDEKTTRRAPPPIVTANVEGNKADVNKN